MLCWYVILLCILSGCRNEVVQMWILTKYKFSPSYLLWKFIFPVFISLFQSMTYKRIKKYYDFNLLNKVPPWAIKCLVHTNARRRRSSLNEAIVSLYSTLAAAAPRWDCSAVVVVVGAVEATPPPHHRRCTAPGPSDKCGPLTQPENISLAIRLPTFHSLLHTAHTTRTIFICSWPSWLHLDFKFCW